MNRPNENALSFFKTILYENIEQNDNVVIADDFNRLASEIYHEEGFNYMQNIPHVIKGNEGKNISKFVKSLKLYK